MIRTQCGPRGQARQHTGPMWSPRPPLTHGPAHPMAPAVPLLSPTRLSSALTPTTSRSRSRVGSSTRTSLCSAGISPSRGHFHQPHMGSRDQEPSIPSCGRELVRGAAPEGQDHVSPRVGPLPPAGHRRNPAPPDSPSSGLPGTGTLLSSRLGNRPQWSPAKVQGHK